MSEPGAALLKRAANHCDRYARVHALNAFIHGQDDPNYSSRLIAAEYFEARDFLISRLPPALQDDACWWDETVPKL